MINILNLLGYMTTGDIQPWSDVQGLELLFASIAVCVGLSMAVQNQLPKAQAAADARFEKWNSWIERMEAEREQAKQM